MYIFSERGDQELSKTVSIMFIRHFWTILQYLKVRGVFSGIEYWVGYTSRYIRTQKDDRMYGYLVVFLKGKWHIRRYRIAIVELWC